MARFIFGMNMSLDGYVDHDKYAPEPSMFRYWITKVGTATGSIYGRRMYETMRYWDEDQPDWTAEHREFAEAWRRQRKWVVSRTLTSVGPSATLISADIEAQIRAVKTEQSGIIGVSGPQLAHSLGALIDEYRLYLHPHVLGQGTPFFAGPRPPLCLVSSERIGDSVIGLTYIPA